MDKIQMIAARTGYSEAEVEEAHRKHQYARSVAVAHMAVSLIELLDMGENVRHSFR